MHVQPNCIATCTFATCTLTSAVSSLLVLCGCCLHVLQGDQLYIQMELCGDSLAATARLRDKQPWREAELVGLLKQVRKPMGCHLAWWQARGSGWVSQKPASCPGSQAIGA